MRQVWRRWAVPETTIPVSQDKKQVLILSNGDNASISYILQPHLAEAACAIHRLDPARDGGSAAIPAAGTLVIARYLPPGWLEPLRRFRADGGVIVYFMDDDLMDAEALHGLPAAYAKKIQRLAVDQRKTLEALCDEFWVASPYLAHKYRAWSPRLLQAKPATAYVEGRPGTTICYHGTASHQDELNWLVPVVRSLQERRLDTHFEVFGDHAVNKRFRDLPRTAVLHPMSWANYQSFTAAMPRDIALAPLMPNPFNAARGPTKFFDFARMGAVGIYTDVAPYRDFVRDGIDGLLLPNDPLLWVDKIAELVTDAPRRRQLAQAARQRAHDMAWDAPE